MTRRENEMRERILSLEGQLVKAAIMITEAREERDEFRRLLDKGPAASVEAQAEINHWRERAETAEADRDRLLEWSGQNAVRAERAEDRAEAAEEKLWRIKQWCEAYPIDIFPEPDLAKARKILKEHDMSVDAISASAMRHVVTGIKKLIEEKS